MVTSVPKHSKICVCFKSIQKLDGHPVDLIQQGWNCSCWLVSFKKKMAKNNKLPVL